MATSFSKCLRTASFIFAVGSATFAFAASPAPETPAKPQANPQETSAASQASNEFGVELYQQLARERGGEQIFIAPFSIGAALTMAAEGAVDETAREMNKTLHLPQTDLAGVHRGLAELRRQITPVDPPAATLKKIATLRAELKQANTQTQTFINSNKYDAAQKSGAVAEKLATELNALLKQTRPYELQIANALWAERTYPFREEYIRALRPTYGATLFPVDFKSNAEASRGKINQWVEEHTNDRIKDLIGPGMLDKLTRLVITNTVFFQGEWEEPFEESSTNAMPFAIDEQRTKQVRMMRKYVQGGAYAAFNGDGSAFNTPREIPIEMRDDDPQLYPDEKGFEMVSLPYRGKRLAMTVILPRSVTGLAAIEKQLSGKELQTQQRRLESRTVEVFLPRFKLEADYALREPLKSLGMVRAFQDTALPNGAQFEKMTSDPDPNHRLYITQVLHKTYVEVNEKGTEAAAASAVIFAAPTAAPFDQPEPPKTKPFTPRFKADKPFLFLIRDRETGTILFLGRVLQPQDA